MTARGRSTGGGVQLVLGMCAFFTARIIQIGRVGGGRRRRRRQTSIFNSKLIESNSTAK